MSTHKGVPPGSCWRLPASSMADLDAKCAAGPLWFFHWTIGSSALDEKGIHRISTFFSWAGISRFPPEKPMESKNCCDHMTASFDQSMDVLELLGWKFCRGLAQVVQDGKMISAKGFHAGRCQAVFGLQIREAGRGWMLHSV